MKYTVLLMVALVALAVWAAHSTEAVHHRSFSVGETKFHDIKEATAFHRPDGNKEKIKAERGYCKRDTTVASEGERVIHHGREPLRTSAFRGAREEPLSHASSSHVKPDPIKSMVHTKIRIANPEEWRAKYGERLTAHQARMEKHFGKGPAHSARNYIYRSETAYPFTSTPLLAKDDRYTYPYSTVGAVIGYVQNGCDYILTDFCTATVVEKSVIITERNCAFNAQRAVFLPSFQFESFGMYGDFIQGSSYGMWDVIDGYDDGLDPDCDDGANYWALLVIDRKTPTDAAWEDYTVGSLTGWMGLGMFPLGEMTSIVGHSFFGYGPRNVEERGYGFGIPQFTVSTAPMAFSETYGGNYSSGYYPAIEPFIGAPFVVNLGTENVDHADAGYDSGSNSKRNIVVGIADYDRSYSASDGGLLELAPFSNTLADALSELCYDYCWACSNGCIDGTDCNVGDLVTDSHSPANDRPSAMAETVTNDWNIYYGKGRSAEGDQKAERQQPHQLARQPRMAGIQAVEKSDGKLSAKNVAERMGKSSGGKQAQHLAREMTSAHLREFSVQLNGGHVRDVEHGHHDKKQHHGKKQAHKLHTRDVSHHEERNFFGGGQGPFSSSPIIVESNRFIFPYSALGKIFTFNESNMVVATCTGAVIGPSIVAADPGCLAPEANTTYMWEFYPAWQQQKSSSDELSGTSLGMYVGQAAFAQPDYSDGLSSKAAGVLVLQPAVNEHFSYRTHVVGSVTGWFGLDPYADPIDNLVTQAAYSNTHYPGRLQIVATSYGSMTNVTSPDSDENVLGYNTDIFETHGVPSIVNFGSYFNGPSPFWADIFDNLKREGQEERGVPLPGFGGEYPYSNVLIGLAGIPANRTNGFGSDADVTDTQTYLEPFDGWYWDVIDAACTAHCYACDDEIYLGGPAKRGFSDDWPDNPAVLPVFNGNGCMETPLGNLCCENNFAKCCYGFLGCLEQTCDDYQPGPL